MRKFWAVSAKLGAILFSAAFVLSAVISMLLTSIDRRLLSASIYKNALAQQQVYNRLPGVLAEQLATAVESNPAGGGQNPPEISPALGLQNLSTDNWDSIVTSLAPPDLLRSEAEGVIDQFFAYLNGQQDGVNLDLNPMKNRLVSSAGQESLLSLIRAQPACTPEQIAQFLLNVLGGQGLSICRPPDSILEQAVPFLPAALKQLADLLPNQIALLPPDPSNNLAIAVRNARLIMRLSPDLPLGFLLLISLLAVRTPKQWLRWWGIPLCVTGLVASLGVLILSTTFERIWNLRIVPLLPSSLPLGLIALGHDLLRAVFNAWLGGLLLMGIFYGLVGLGLSIGSMFIRDVERPDLSPNSSQAAA